MINRDLARTRGLASSAIEKIEELQLTRSVIHQEIFNAVQARKDPVLIYQIAEPLWGLEADLQRLWGFDVNLNRYRFWRVFGCRCPQVTNEDNYPHGPYAMSADCPLHGQRLYLQTTEENKKPG